MQLLKLNVVTKREREGVSVRGWKDIETERESKLEVKSK